MIAPIAPRGMEGPPPSRLSTLLHLGAAVFGFGVLPIVFLLLVLLELDDFPPGVQRRGHDVCGLQQLELARKMLGIEEEACHYCERPKWHESDCPVLLDEMAEGLPIG